LPLVAEEMREFPKAAASTVLAFIGPQLCSQLFVFSQNPLFEKIKEEAKPRGQMNTSQNRRKLETGLEHDAERLRLDTFDYVRSNSNRGFFEKRSSVPFPVSFPFLSKVK
jgi:hypothetical protein